MNRWGGATGEDSNESDGVNECWLAGTDPPAPPRADALPVELSADGAVADEPRYVIRVSLVEASEAYALRVIKELEEEVSVLGTTHDRSEGADPPEQFDVVVSMEYHPTTVADALVEPPQIEAAAVRRLNRPTTGRRDADSTDEADANDAPRPGADREAGGRSAAKRGAGDRSGTEREDAGGHAGPRGGSDVRGSDEDGSADAHGADTTADARRADATADARRTDARGADDDAVDEAISDLESDSGADAGRGESERNERGGGADAGPGGDRTSPHGHEEFEQLKRETDQLPYDEFIAELDDASIPGDFGDEVDLDPILEEAEEAVSAGTPNAVDDEGTGGPPALVHGDGGVGGRVFDPPGETAGTTDASLDPDLVVEALVTAAEEDALSDEQRRTLAGEFTEGPPTTYLVRLDHLQREVDELAAYKEALEAFIDQYGSGATLVERVREVVTRFRGDLDEVANDLDGLTETIDAHGERIGRVEDDLDGLHELRSRVTDLEDRIETLDDLEDRIETLDDLERRLERLSAVETRLENVRTGLEAEIDDVRREFDSAVDAEPRVETIERRIDATETQQSDLLDRLDSTETRVDEVEEWWSSLQTILGGPTPPGPSRPPGDGGVAEPDEFDDQETDTDEFDDQETDTDEFDDQETDTDEFDDQETDTDSTA